MITIDSKAEQVVLCVNDVAVSDNIFREILQNVEDILQLLELPYRIMSVCSGDMSQKTYKHGIKTLYEWHEIIKVEVGI